MERRFYGKNPHRHLLILHFTKHFVVADLSMSMATLSSASKASAVPVFGVSRVHSTQLGESLKFSCQEFEANATHGSFDNVTGLFRANTAGLYLFFFNGTSWNGSGNTRVDLRVNAVPKAVCQAHDTGHSESGSSLAISAWLQLNRGDLVGVFLTCGRYLYECRDENSAGCAYTRFSAILFGS